MGNESSSPREGGRSSRRGDDSTTSGGGGGGGGGGGRPEGSFHGHAKNLHRSLSKMAGEDSAAAYLVDNLCSTTFFSSGSDDRGRGRNKGTRGVYSDEDDEASFEDDDTYEDYDQQGKKHNSASAGPKDGGRKDRNRDTEGADGGFSFGSDDYTESTDANARKDDKRRDERRSNSQDDSDTYDGESLEDEAGGEDETASLEETEKRRKHAESESMASSGALTQSSDVPGTTLLSKPLASSFAKRCYFTKAGIGKTTQHYEGLTLTGNVVLMLASAMKLKGCPTICDEDLRRVEQTYPNQFSRLPDELLLSSGWRRISKYCHFSNKPVPDGVPFFHSKRRIHPTTGGYYFLLAAAVGMVRPIDVEPLTLDTLIVLQTDYPTQCDSAPQELIGDPAEWTLVDKFCFFSGGPINTEEDVYYSADFDGNEIYMLAFLSPSLTPEELYRLGPDGEVDDNGLKSVEAVEEVEGVYDLTERDFDDLRLYHLGPCRALPQYILQPNSWTKVLPPHFVQARQKALDRAREFEAGNNVFAQTSGHAGAEGINNQDGQHQPIMLGPDGQPVPMMGQGWDGPPYMNGQNHYTDDPQHLPPEMQSNQWEIQQQYLDGQPQSYPEQSMGIEQTIGLDHQQSYGDPQQHTSGMMSPGHGSVQGSIHGSQGYVELGMNTSMSTVKATPDGNGGQLLSPGRNHPPYGEQQLHGGPGQAEQWQQPAPYPTGAYGHHNFRSAGSAMSPYGEPVQQNTSQQNTSQHAIQDQQNQGDVNNSGGPIPPPSPAYGMTRVGSIDTRSSTPVFYGGQNQMPTQLQPHQQGSFGQEVPNVQDGGYGIHQPTEDEDIEEQRTQGAHSPISEKNPNIFSFYDPEAGVGKGSDVKDDAVVETGKDGVVNENENGQRTISPPPSSLVSVRNTNSADPYSLPIPHSQSGISHSSKQSGQPPQLPRYPPQSESATDEIVKKASGSQSSWVKAKELRREVEEEGAFSASDGDQPLDEAIALRAGQLKLSPSDRDQSVAGDSFNPSTGPESFNQSIDPPEISPVEYNRFDQQLRMDPPEDEPPSLSLTQPADEEDDGKVLVDAPTSETDFNDEDEHGAISRADPSGEEDTFDYNTNFNSEQPEPLPIQEDKKEEIHTDIYESHPSEVYDQEIAPEDPHDLDQSAIDEIPVQSEINEAPPQPVLFSNQAIGTPASNHISDVEATPGAKSVNSIPNDIEYDTTKDVFTPEAISNHSANEFTSGDIHANLDYDAAGDSNEPITKKPQVGEYDINNNEMLETQRGPDESVEFDDNNDVPTLNEQGQGVEREEDDFAPENIPSDFQSDPNMVKTTAENEHEYYEEDQYEENVPKSTSYRSHGTSYGQEYSHDGSKYSRNSNYDEKKSDHHSYSQDDGENSHRHSTRKSDHQSDYEDSPQSRNYDDNEGSFSLRSGHRSNYEVNEDTLSPLSGQRSGYEGNDESFSARSGQQSNFEDNETFSPRSAEHQSDYDDSPQRSNYEGNEEPFSPRSGQRSIYDDNEGVFSPRSNERNNYEGNEEPYSPGSRDVEASYDDNERQDFSSSPRDEENYDEFSPRGDSMSRNESYSRYEEDDDGYYSSPSLRGSQAPGEDGEEYTPRSEDDQEQASKPDSYYESPESQGSRSRSRSRSRSQSRSRTRENNEQEPLSPYSASPKSTVRTESPHHASDASGKSEYTPSSAMRGARELLRKKRQRSLALAKGRRLGRDSSSGVRSAKSPESDLTSVKSGGSISVHSPVSYGKREDSVPEPQAREMGASPSNGRPNEINWDSSTDTSIVSGSSVWTDTTTPPDRTSRRALILQMAKARMKSNKSTTSSKTPSVTTSIAEESKANNSRSSRRSYASRRMQAQKSVPKRVSNPEPEPLNPTELDFTGDLD